MVKPVFAAASNIRSAATADEAFEVALLFLSSPDAKTATPSQAGTFLADVKATFGAHQSPDQYKMLLRMTGTLNNPSSHMKQFALIALTEQLAEEKYRAEATPILLNNAKILGGVRATDAHGKDGSFIQHEGGSESAYAGIHAARSANFLKEAINSMFLVEPDVGDDYAAGFMHTLQVAFRRTEATPHEQVEMLTMIADFSSEKSKLYDLVVAKAVEINDAHEGRRPLAGLVRSGHDFKLG